MINGKPVLAVIPARGGSKGIPRKNIKLLGGKPLITWAIECALAVPQIDRVIVSTDDEEIAQVARNAGADIPFLRPAELARDDTQGIMVELHAIDQLPRYDYIVRLQPTSPFRSVGDVQTALSLSEQHDGDPVVSLTETDKPPEWIFRMTADKLLKPVVDTPISSTNRQALQPAYVLNGAVYVGSAVYLKTHKSFLTSDSRGFSMPARRSFDLDTLEDWEIAETMVVKNSTRAFDPE